MTGPMRQTPGPTKIFGFFVLLVCPCILCFLTPSRFGTSERRHTPRDPPLKPLRPKKPTKIRHRRLPAQPQSHLMSLPLELRQCIYAHALGGRVVDLTRHTWWLEKRYTVRSSCLEFDDVPPGDLPLLTLAPPIPTALLRSCRQIYFEAIPALYTLTTLRLQLSEFDEVLGAALGRHRIPDIRRLYLCHRYFSPSGPPQWDAVFAALCEMRLERLVFEFDMLSDDAERETGDVLATAWGRGVCGLRGLRWFDLVVRYGDPCAHPHLKRDLVRRVREVAIGTHNEAEELG
ncbi:hypothetical protein B0H17DRAFT_1061100 [Mycena rosella]|uniref:DUF7730 domain-containing protein n=1 Tax=Mycena rosella TaxID=1033263 RepID=A0AAD7DIT6_MYCRO|nr:hypothetical protein B0H17DRAFT_1061100 [Mycena rosella]